MSFPSIRQLKYLVVAAECGSIRKAAQQMRVTQPTVTAQIANLEEKFETKLLERTPQGAKLTASGRTLIHHIKLLIAQYEQVCGLARDMSQTPSGTHNVGVPDTFGPYLLPEIIPELHKVFPSIRFFVREDTPNKLENGLHQGIYDFILSPLPIEVNELHAEFLFQEPLHLIAEPDHPLALQKQVMPEALRGGKLLVIDERHRFFSEVMALAASLGMELMRDYSGTSLDTLRLMVGTGMGLSILPALYVHSEIRYRCDVVSVDLGFELPARRMAMVWRKKTPQKHLYKKISTVIKSAVKSRLSDVVKLDEDVRTP